MRFDLEKQEDDSIKSSVTDDSMWHEPWQFYSHIKQENLDIKDSVTHIVREINQSQRHSQWPNTSPHPAGQVAWTLTPAWTEKRLVWPCLWPHHKEAFCLPLISLSSLSRHPDNHHRPPHRGPRKAQAVSSTLLQSASIQQHKHKWGTLNILLFIDLFSQTVPQLQL